MKTTLFVAGAFALALVAPLSVSAQQAPPPGYQNQAHQHTTPDEPTMQRHWQKRLGRLNLSGDQQQRISSLIDRYARTHPAGSPPDRAGNHALRQQIMSVLTPDQLQQYRQMHHHGQHAQNGQAGNQPYDQGQPSQQYGDPRDQQQGPPPNDEGPQDQGQGPPPDQGQGPPPDQGQGPPPDQGQGPPPDQGQGPPPDQSQGPPPAA